jgi:hypothetical protein
MGESNYCDSHTAAYQQEVRRVEEKFNGFELHHILRRDNKVVDAFARLGLSREPPPLSVFMQDLFKPSIWFEEDTLVCSLGASPDKGNSIPILRTPLGENGSAPVSEANSGVSVGPITPSAEPVGEVVAIVRPPSPW